ncbi:MAG: DUF3180 family protein [Candidatus Nanopelagicales bacterium]
MKQTKISRLLILILLTAWISGVLAFVLRQQFQVFIQFPLNYFIATLSIAAAMLVWTLLARNRIAGSARTLTSLQAARTAALALAGSHTGALLAGVSFGILVNYLFVAPTQANTERIQVLSLTILSAILLIAISLWLERICTVPDKRDDK